MRPVDFPRPCPPSLPRWCLGPYATTVGAVGVLRAYFTFYYNRYRVSDGSQFGANFSVLIKNRLFSKRRPIARLGQ